MLMKRIPPELLPVSLGQEAHNHDGIVPFLPGDLAALELLDLSSGQDIWDAVEYPGPLSRVEHCSDPLFPGVIRRVGEIREVHVPELGDYAFDIR